jgi:chromosomal replication initiator protein
VLSAPNAFSAQWVIEHYKKIIEDTLSQICEKTCKIDIAVDPPAMVKSALQEKKIRPKKEKKLDTGFPDYQSGLDSRYIFDNFVVGASNQFAHASTVVVAEHPGKQYNPLFLYSPPGLGKTHLLHAVGNRLLAINPGARVLYISAERFVNELIESLQHRKMQEFRSKYRDSFDLLLIDDIQFIAGKNTSEEEFFHTFNTLYSNKRQIIVSSDRPPKEIKGLEERVRTRFEWGLVVDISPPEIETRIAILKSKAEKDDIYLPDDAAVFLATHVKSNIRELEGVLIRLQAKASMAGTEISLEMVEQELKNYAPNSTAKKYTVEAIQSAVAKHYQIKINELKSSVRSSSIVLPRQIAMFLVRKYTSLGLKEIGSYFGGKDHSTILHACQKIEKAIANNTEIKDAVEKVQNLL